MKKRWMIVIAAIFALICIGASAEMEIPLKIKLEGKWYEMPCELSKFLKNGWKLYDYENYETGDLIDTAQLVPTGKVGDTLKTYRLIKNKRIAEVELKNEHLIEWAIEGCVVSKINVVESRSPARVSCEGIEFGVTTRDKLPDWARESFDKDGFANYHLWDYENNYSCGISAFIDEGKAVGHMIISAEHMSPTQDALNELDGYTEYIPGEFDSYEAPMEFDKDWASGVVLLDGKLYQMPVPMREFVADGWRIVEDTWVLPGEVDHCTMIKGDLEVQVQVHNIMTGKGKSEQPAKLYNCEADMLFIMPADRSYFRVGRYENGMSRHGMKIVSGIYPGQKVQLNEKESDEENECYEASVVLHKGETMDVKETGYHHAVYELVLFADDKEIGQIGVGYSPYYDWEYE